MRVQQGRGEGGEWRGDAGFVLLLTFEEGSEVVEGTVIRAAVPAAQRQPVKGLQAEGFFTTVHHHHLGRISVEAGDVLGVDRGQRRAAIGSGGSTNVSLVPLPHPHLDVVPIHVTGGVAEEAVGDEAVWVDAVDEGEGGLGRER